MVCSVKTALLTQQRPLVGITDKEKSQGEDHKLLFAGLCLQGTHLLMAN